MFNRGWGGWFAYHVAVSSLRMLAPKEGEKLMGRSLWVKGKSDCIGPFVQAGWLAS